MVTTLPITEKQMERQIADLARLFGWERAHAWTSIHSPSGFPDDVLVRPPRIVMLELKSAKGKLTERQEKWGELLKACPQIEYRIIRPDDLESVAELLR